MHALFDRLFPHGFAGADVLAEIAPDAWERSPLLACFHPPVERVFDERLQFHRNLAKLCSMQSKREGARDAASSPEPTLDDAQREYQPHPVHQDEELWTCVADIGSFRRAGAFLDEHLIASRDSWHEGDYLRFYLGMIWIGGRADLTPVYAMIFWRFKALDSDWIYHFPELGLLDLTPPHAEAELRPTGYSVSEAAVTRAWPTSTARTSNSSRKRSNEMMPARRPPRCSVG